MWGNIIEFKLVYIRTELSIMTIRTELSSHFTEGKQSYDSYEFKGGLLITVVQLNIGWQIWFIRGAQIFKSSAHHVAHFLTKSFTRHLNETEKCFTVCWKSSENV